MGMQRRPCTPAILLTACLAFADIAHAACTGPQALTAKLRAQPTSENAIQLGSWFAGHKQFDCAAETFRSAQKADPNSAQLHYLEGLALVGSGQESTAIPALQKAIQLQPGVIKPHLLLANLYEHAGNTTAADDQWKKALAIDPKSAIALDDFSSALLARKDYVGIVDLLERAPRTEALTIRLAEALTELDHLNDANAVLLEAMKLSPDSLPLANAESVVLIKQRSYLEATKLWKYMAERHPGDRAAELPYLRVLVLTEHNDLARPLGLKLLAQTPHNWEVLYLNGVVDYAVGDYANSKAHLEEAVSLVPDFFYSRYHLGVVLVALHEWKEAKENLEKAIALGELDKKVHYELAMALHGLGETDRAAQELQQYQDYRQTEEKNTEAASLTAQAEAELTAGNVKDAVEHYRQACDVSPNNAGYKFKLSVALHKAGDLEGERAQLEQAVKLDPQLAPAQKQLGYLMARSGDAAGAVEHFQLAVHAAPRWVEAWINLAAELAVEEHFPEARDAAETALRLDPTNEQARKLNDQLAHDPAAQQAQP
ncbi:MAG: tetratricopeptide repeat protein [Terracidiphilus sp.]